MYYRLESKVVIYKVQKEEELGIARNLSEHERESKRCNGSTALTRDRRKVQARHASVSAPEKAIDDFQSSSSAPP